nr:hypothetical protein [Agrobacterium rosae]
LQETGDGANLADTLREAWDRGPSWRRALTAGVEAVDKQYQPAVHQIFAILPTDEVHHHST